MNKGFTIIELMITIGMLALLMGIAMYVFQVIITTWVSTEGRTGIALRTDRAMGMMVGNVRVKNAQTGRTPDGLREATAVFSTGNGTAEKHEIRFAVKQRQSDGTAIPGSYDHFIYYFYNAADAYPPSFNQSSYELRRSVLAGSDLRTGTFTYGAGDFVASGMLSPHTASPAHPSDLAVSGGVVTLDLSIKSGSETIRTRTQVTPRNL